MWKQKQTTASTVEAFKGIVNVLQDTSIVVIQQTDTVKAFTYLGIYVNIHI